MAICAATTCLVTAPAECGWWTGTGPCWHPANATAFLAGYQRAVGRGIDLDADLLAFFLLRRNLDDLVDWLGSVLAADRPIQQRRADLDGVRWCLERWAALEARIQHTRGVLAQQRRSR
jgi:hypothetical protein